MISLGLVLIVFGFSAYDRELVDCTHKSVLLSHDDADGSFNRARLWGTMDALLERVPVDPDVMTGTLGTAHHAILSCAGGLHRSQATARLIGEFIAGRGFSVCVLNAATFNSRW